MLFPHFVTMEGHSKHCRVGGKRLIGPCVYQSYRLWRSIEGSCLLTQAITYPWIKLMTFGLCEDVKIIKIKFNNFSDTVYMLFYRRNTRRKHLRCIWQVLLDDSELKRMYWNSILNRSLLKTSFHYLLSFTFLIFFIHRPLFPAASSISWYQSCFVWDGWAHNNNN